VLERADEDELQRQALETMRARISGGSASLFSATASGTRPVPLGRAGRSGTMSNMALGRQASMAGGGGGGGLTLENVSSAAGAAQRRAIDESNLLDELEIAFTAPVSQLDNANAFGGLMAVHPNLAKGAASASDNGNGSGTGAAASSIESLIASKSATFRGAIGSIVNARRAVTGARSASGSVVGGSKGGASSKQKGAAAAAGAAASGRARRASTIAAPDLSTANADDFRSYAKDADDGREGGRGGDDDDDDEEDDEEDEDDQDGDGDENGDDGTGGDLTARLQREAARRAAAKPYLSVTKSAAASAVDQFAAAAKAQLSAAEAAAAIVASIYVPTPAFDSSSSSSPSSPSSAAAAASKSNTSRASKARAAEDRRAQRQAKKDAENAKRAAVDMRALLMADGYGDSTSGGGGGPADGAENAELRRHQRRLMRVMRRRAGEPDVSESDEDDDENEDGGVTQAERAARDAAILTDMIAQAAAKAARYGADIDGQC
jgi:hypothetical protein